MRYSPLSLILLIAPLLLAACGGDKHYGLPEQQWNAVNAALYPAGRNGDSLRQLFSQIPESQCQGLAFLIEYMPEKDLRAISPELVRNNLTYAYKARERYVWARKVPWEIFYNDVLPYASLNEHRDDWRKDFFDRFSPIADSAASIKEAVLLVNRYARDLLLVDYNTAREKPDQSPYESIRQRMASCTGLSILLVDAFRSVGIPARIAGTPNWHDKRGNHNWVEVWIDGEWYFTEYYPSGLNQSWFLADAGQAKSDDPECAIYASSWKSTDTIFPMVWDLEDRSVSAHNVTNRYVRLYQQQKSDEEVNGTHVWLGVEVLTQDTSIADPLQQRVPTNVDVFDEDGNQMGGGRTSSSRSDANQHMRVHLPKNKCYLLKFYDSSGYEHSLKVKLRESDELVYMRTPDRP